MLGFLPPSQEQANCLARPSLAAVFVGHVYGIDGRHVSST
jgi:hypothetical protein